MRHRAIAELGFAQASLAQIAKRAGVSTGVILYYFAGKDDLIRAVIAHIFATGRGAHPAAASNARRRRAARCEAFIRASVALHRPAAQPMPRAMMNIIRAGATRRGGPRFDPGVTSGPPPGFESILDLGPERAALSGRSRFR